MTKLTVYNAHRVPVLLDAQPLGQGGEGVVYKVKNHHLKGNYVAKIYHPQEQTPQRETKVKYLIDHKPEFSLSNSVIFPEEPLYNEDQKFIGFLMKQTVNQVDITSLCSLKPSAKLDKTWHYKYHRYSKLGTHSRIRVCYNIARAFHQLHQTRQFVFVDIKPENIKLTYEGEVSLIDVDSVQIAEAKDLKFAAQKVTHEYSPAEINQLNFKSEHVPESWDRFSLAVVFYKILFGLHPYTGSTLPPYDQLVTNEQKIANGLFVHGHKKQSFKVIPTPHQNFWLIPKRLQALFIQAFEDGHTNPSLRPSMQEWMTVLDSVPEFELEPVHATADWQPAYKATANNHSQIGASAKTQTRWQRLRARVVEDVMVFSMVGVMALFGMGTLWGIANGTFASIGKHSGAEHTLRIGVFHEGLAWKEVSKNRFMYINRWNQRAFRGTFEEAYDFSNGLAKVKKNGKYGAINLQGHAIIPFAYDEMRGKTIPAGKKAIQVKARGKFGLINHQGEEIIPIEYDHMWYNAHTGVVELGKNGRFGLYDQEGVELAPLKFKSRAQMLKETKELLKIYYSIK
ncbi:hypothetical protein BKI52_17525 [marine bacterium AO1-C]|nr:hypothetical protein BKI52_17525 [marine bacterium AO1-C]